MQKTLFLRIAPLAIVVGCATSRPVDVHTSDALITSKIEAKLAADADTNPFEIDVDTLNGRVRLRGLVESESERREAEHLARMTEGVQSVDNQLQIGDLSIGQNLYDAWLVTKVATKLAVDPEVDSRDIDVDVYDGRVTLSGLVTTLRARQEAERLAKATDGVTGVRNEIRVR